MRSEVRVVAVVAAFARDLEAGDAAAARGWPAGALSSYAVSKAALNAYSRVLARRHVYAGRGTGTTYACRTDWAEATTQPTATANLGMTRPAQPGPPPSGLRARAHHTPL
ncbi:uncharacterized protein LOC120687493 [Panicum virgatum]|uniref:uncharacterized protein LOC120687493 n=1 Tax=Panicum virgatum TaxID=38727 RepID=UPI0019D6465E|nr:uncharacterized protein LOC120687493 [Panicum virgatum]